MKLNEDHHVHSTQSDGRNTPEENLERAKYLGLATLTMVEHVRCDTTWVPDFANLVARLDLKSDVRVRGGLETKMINAFGECDLPEDLALTDNLRIYIADHRFVYRDTTYLPVEVRKMILAKRFTLQEAIEILVEATLRAMLRYPGSVLAHLFSVLPKIGANESQVTDDMLYALASIAQETQCVLEVDERWRCPSLRVTRAFHDAGVEILASSDAHRAEDIGRYDYVAELHQMLYTPRAARTLGPCVFTSLR